MIMIMPKLCLVAYIMYLYLRRNDLYYPLLQSPAVLAKPPA